MKCNTYALVLTGKDDPMWPFLLKACTEQERNQLLLYPTDQPQYAQCSYDPVSMSAEFLINGKTYSGEEIRGLWYRRIIPPNYSSFSQDLSEYCIDEYQHFYMGLENSLPHAVWVSKPSAIERSRDKAFQLNLANSLGFKTPETRFSNSPNIVDEFSKKSSIYKSICSPQIPLKEDKFTTVFTSLLDENAILYKNGITSCPGIFQEFCSKVADIRVTVFGEELFPVSINSQSNDASRIDFRVAARILNYSIHELPDDILEGCIQLVAKCNLNFGAIDLGLLSDGSYIFFEINPNGQWGWLEEETGQQMRRALINLLLS